MDLERNLRHFVWCANELAKRKFPKLPWTALIVSYVPLIPLSRDLASFDPNRNQSTAFPTFEVTWRVYPSLSRFKHHAQTVVIHQDQLSVLHLRMTGRIKSMQNLYRCQGLVNSPSKGPICYQFVIITKFPMRVEKLRFSFWGLLLFLLFKNI